MKYVKIFSLAVVSALALAACQKTNYPEFSFGPEQDADPVSNPITEVFFNVTSAEEEIDPAAETYDIAVSRSSTTGALSVPVIVEDLAGVFKVPNTIEFADGAATTTLTVDISGMELETVYDLVISVPIDYFYTYMDADYYAKEKGIDLNNDKYSFHLNALKQKWIPAGTCTFYDYTMNDDEYPQARVVENCTVQQHEGTDDYRIIGAYSAFGAAMPNITFSIVPNEKEEWNEVVVFPEEGIYNLWPGYGYAYWTPSSYADYCYVNYYLGELSETSVYIEVGFLFTPDLKKLYVGGFDFDWDGYPYYGENDAQ